MRKYLLKGLCATLLLSAMAFSMVACSGDANTGDTGTSSDTGTSDSADTGDVAN